MEVTEKLKGLGLGAVLEISWSVLVAGAVVKTQDRWQDAARPASSPERQVVGWLGGQGGCLFMIESLMLGRIPT